jgi:hypothetical protein
MVLWNLLDGGASHSGPLLGPYESMRGDTLGTNPRQEVICCLNSDYILLDDNPFCLLNARGFS